MTVPTQLIAMMTGDYQLAPCAYCHHATIKRFRSYGSIIPMPLCEGCAKHMDREELSFVSQRYVARWMAGA
jgi:hypothetical protein